MKCETLLCVSDGEILRGLTSWLWCSATRGLAALKQTNKVGPFLIQTFGNWNVPRSSFRENRHYIAPKISAVVWVTALQFLLANPIGHSRHSGSFLHHSEHFFQQLSRILSSQTCRDAFRSFGCWEVFNFPLRWNKGLTLLQSNHWSSKRTC